MSFSDLAVAAVAAVCFNLLWWCRSLACHLGHVERTQAKRLGGDRAHFVTATEQDGEATPAPRADAAPECNIPIHIETVAQHRFAVAAP